MNEVIAILFFSLRSHKDITIDKVAFLFLLSYMQTPRLPVRDRERVTKRGETIWEGDKDGAPLPTNCGSIEQPGGGFFFISSPRQRKY